MTQAIRQTKILAALASVLGQAKGQATWADAARSVGVPLVEFYTREQAVTVLQSLASSPGPVGLAARLARLRLDEEEAPRIMSASSMPAVPVPDPEPAAPPRTAGSSSSMPVVRVSVPAQAELPPVSASFPAPPVIHDPEGRRSGSVEPPGPRSTRPTSTSIPASGRHSVDLLPFFVPALGQQKAAETLQHYARLLNLALGAMSHDEAIRLLEAISAEEGVVGVVARLAKTKVLALRPI
jgi:hypothetical protein